MRRRAADRVASVILAIEGAGLLALAGWQVVALAGGDTGSAVDAIALIVLTVAGAAAVLAFAAAAWLGASWGRSGGIVTQLLVLAVALGAVTGGYAHPLIGGLLAVPAVAGLVALFLAVRRTGAEKKAAEEHDAGSQDAGKKRGGR